MKKCIYCNSVKRLTKSHIIPDALSNGSMKNTNVCELHNSKFSDSFESYVSKNLSFIANNLDIKSSKSNNYPAFTITYSWKGKKYIDDKHTNLNLNLDKIIESTDRTSKIGPNYIVDKIKGQHSIESIVPNDQNLRPTIEFNIGIFYSTEMKQLICKIAYEWFCSLNKIDNKPQFGEEIRRFILGKTTHNTVKVITDNNIVEAFTNIGNEKSHQLISYVDNNDNYCVMINFWGIIIYQVVICSKSEFPESIQFFYREQQINSAHLPYSRNNLDELYLDMNVAITDLFGSEALIYESIISSDFTIKALKASKIAQNYHFKSNLLLLLNVVREYYNSKEDIALSYKMLDNNIQELLSTHVIHPRKIKRVAQSLVIENNKLNTINLGSSQFPIIHFLYCLGKSKFNNFNRLNLTEFIKEDYDKHIRNISDISPNPFEILLNEMDNDTDCIAHIQKGVEIFNYLQN